MEYDAAVSRQTSSKERGSLVFAHTNPPSRCRLAATFLFPQSPNVWMLAAGLHQFQYWAGHDIMQYVKTEDVHGMDFVLDLTQVSIFSGNPEIKL